MARWRDGEDGLFVGISTKAERVIGRSAVVDARNGTPLDDNDRCGDQLN
jgi:hypothetical protein